MLSLVDFVLTSVNSEFMRVSVKIATWDLSGVLRIPWVLGMIECRVKLIDDSVAWISIVGS